MHMQETSIKTLYVPTSENIKRAHANTSIRGLANVVSSLMRSHARHVITMHVCTRTDNVASTRVSRGVPTGGGRIGRYATPASVNFVFFARKNEKKPHF